MHSGSRHHPVPFSYYYRQESENYTTFQNENILGKTIEKGAGLDDGQNDIYINKLDLYLAT